MIKQLNFYFANIQKTFKTTKTNAISIKYQKIIDRKNYE